MKINNNNYIKIIHDLAMCNTTIENFYKMLLHKYYSKEKDIKDPYPKITIGDIFESIEKQIDESKKISKNFFNIIEDENQKE